jgi:hypothetical protein
MKTMALAAVAALAMEPEYPPDQSREPEADQDHPMALWR